MWEISTGAIATRLHWTASQWHGLNAPVGFHGTVSLVAPPGRVAEAVPVEINATNPTTTNLVKRWVMLSVRV